VVVGLTVDVVVGLKDVGAVEVIGFVVVAVVVAGVVVVALPPQPAKINVPARIIASKIKSNFFINSFR
jgi:hypothetical protein